MSWAQIKSALNSSLGKNSFKPLNEIIERESFEVKKRAIEAIAIATDSQEKFVVVEWGKTRIIGTDGLRGLNVEFFLFPNTLQSIGSNALTSNKNIKSITFPKSIQRIGRTAFDGNSSLEKCFFEGTIEEWLKVELDPEWKTGTKITQIVCSDGVSTRLT